MIQGTAARWVMAWHEGMTCVTDMLSELKWQSLEQRWTDIALTVIYDPQCPCPDYTLPPNTFDENCCQCAPSPLSGVSHILWCNTAPTHNLWGYGMPNLLASPWPPSISSTGCARCATISTRPTDHLTHTLIGKLPCLCGWPDEGCGGVGVGVGGVGCNGGDPPGPPLARSPPCTHTNSSLPINKLTTN